ncbi:hypothetical protein [uncultured Clostridium sp.]|uniref:hypothetical protein n=1 Tax=uncultured Clostridium sp. TaxID=59620 RepID=UPI0025E11FC4|nr:hypothetical protein [uncultured Clostridium sp.]
MSTVKVRSKGELERAQKNRVDEIIVVGDLADKLIRAKRVTKMGKISLGVLAALSSAAVTAPLTGGLSFASGSTNCSNDRS